MVAARLVMQLPLQHQVPLSERTTLNVGGPARHWLETPDIAALQQALDWAREQELPVELLGGGSNTLVADGGVDALVLRVSIDHLRAKPTSGGVLLEAGAGLGWDDLVGWAAARGYSGIECLSGIPGDVGAAPIQNIGAYGQEVAEVIERVHVVERQSGTRASLDRDDCGFGYRDSIFKRGAEGRYAIVGVDLRLASAEPATVEHPELARALARRAEPPTAATVRETVLALRREKSMVLDPSDENRRSAGSFFVNPTVTQAQAERVVQAVRDEKGPQAAVPRYPAPRGRIKLSAAWLIEQAGLPKGTREGPVGLSSRHALAIVNLGGASARQIVAFATMVRGRVHERFGVELVPEPRLLGFAPEDIAALLGPLPKPAR